MYSFRILQYCIGMLSSQLIVIYKGEGSSVTVQSVHSQNNWAQFDTDCRKVSNRGQGGARIEHVRPLRPRTDTGVTCRFEL